MTDAPCILFIHVDWDAANAPLDWDLHEQSFIWDKNMELFICMSFTRKKELQSVVKQYSIMRYKKYKVNESKPTLWLVKYENIQSGCKWMVQAVQWQNNDQFKITKYTGPHVCFYSAIAG